MNDSYGNNTPSTINSVSDYQTASELFADIDDLRELLPQLISGDIESRRIALIEIADFGDEDYLPLLLAATVDKAPTLRAEAARLLAGWENDEAVDALLTLLLDAETRAVSAQSLSELKTRAAGLRLLPWAEHGNSAVRTAVLRALRELRLPEAAAPALISLTHADAAVRREAVGILGWLKYGAALPQLASIAIHDDDAEVRRASIGALAMGGDDTVVAALLTALRDDNWSAREEAAATLGKLTPVAAVPALLAALHDDYWQVRVRAARALGRIGDADAVPQLIASLQHTLSNVRKEAAIALGEIGDRGAIPALETAALDADPDVRKAARLALANIESLRRGATQSQ